MDDDTRALEPSPALNTGAGILMMENGDPSVCDVSSVDKISNC